MSYKTKSEDVLIECEICSRKFRGLLSLTHHIRLKEDHPNVQEYLKLYSIEKYVIEKMKRIFNKNYIIDQNTGCWLWTGQVGWDGYGEIYAYSKLKPAHRFSYEIHKGEVSKNLLICHTCDNPKCVNPEHLYAGTHQENMNDRKIEEIMYLVKNIT